MFATIHTNYNKKEIIRELRLISKIRIVKIIKDILFLVNDIKIYVFNETIILVIMRIIMLIK